MTAIADDRSGPRAQSRPRDADGGEFAAHRTQESTNVRFRHLNILAIRRRRPWRDAGRLHKSNGRLTGRPSSAIVNGVKRLHATRSSAQTTLPAARRTSHNTNVPGAMRARTTQGRAADRPHRDDGAPESSSNQNHDDPICHSVGDGTCLRDATASSPVAPGAIRQPTLLRHERLRQLPRARSRGPRGHLPHLRLHPPHPLIR